MADAAPRPNLPAAARYDLVVAANRLPVDREISDDGEVTWHRSPGGLVTAMESVMRGRNGAWVGWAGEAGDPPEPFDEAGMHLHPVGLSAEEVADYYEGFCNDTLWPIYHDVIVPARFHRHWWSAYKAVNRRFAEQVAELVAPGGTVWLHDYQLQLVPSLLREMRPDARIGWFDHIPFPPVELFAQLPWRAELVRGLLGADFLGFQRTADAENFRRSCRRLLGMPVRGERVGVPGTDRYVRAAAVPISVDFGEMERLARSPEVQARAAEIRDSVGNPRTLLLGVDRLDYTKGIRHRLKAYEELLQEGSVTPTETTFVQVATPSRERVEAYRRLRTQVEGTVGRINGEYAPIGSTAVHYLHHSYGKAEMAAFFLAADVMLVTPLRDGMNLVAKEYVSCRYDLGGALVLSEFAGAWHELTRAFVCNPHDIQGLKQTILAAVSATPGERRRRMRSMRARVRDNDVQHWAALYLSALEAAPHRPPDEVDETVGGPADAGAVVADPSAAVHAAQTGQAGETDPAGETVGAGATP